MKTRILTAVIGVPLTILILCLYQMIWFNLIVGIISAIAVYEMLHNTKYVVHFELVIIGMLQAMFIAFSKLAVLEQSFIVVMMAFLFIMLAVMFIKHNEVSFQEVSLAFFVSLVVPYAFSSIVFLRDAIPNVGPYLILMVFTCSWLCDAGAYFVGRVFGKHKLAPTISPKKTIEGAIGGVIISIIINVIFTYVYMWVISRNGGVALQIHVGTLILLVFLASCIGILGDLTASIIKRQCGLKDFGNLFPGHGGVMDRFDSTLLIAPFLYAMVLLVPMVTIL